jgi:hypothetical protein
MEGFTGLKMPEDLFSRFSRKHIFRHLQTCCPVTQRQPAMSDDDAGDGEARKPGRGGVYKMRESYRMLERVRDGWEANPSIGVKARTGLAGRR